MRVCHESLLNTFSSTLRSASDLNDQAALQRLVKSAQNLSAEDALGVMRTFSLALNLVNAAEVHHRLRVIREHEMRPDRSVGPLPMTEDSMRGTIDALLESGLATPDEIYNQLTQQKVEIVLTAHPTEVNRRTQLRKYRKITEILAYLERKDLHPYERTEAMMDLRRKISSLWGSDEIRYV